MTNEEIAKIIIGILASLGGGGAIILWFSNFFARILAKRFEEKIKTKFQKEISEYQSQIEIIKQITIRYSDKQFEQYNNLWSSLYDLQLLAESLWLQATPVKLEKFSRKLRSSKTDIEKASLFIEEVHYKELIQTINSFSEFQIGKSKLINYRQTDSFDQSQVNQMIIDNGKVKSDFEKLVLVVRSDLKKQIRGE